MFRRDNGPLSAAMVYPKIGVCWGCLRVAGAPLPETYCILKVAVTVTPRLLSCYYPAGALSGDCATSLSLVLSGTSL